MRFIQEMGMSKMQIDELRDKFKKYDPTKTGSGSIGKYEIFDTLRGCYSKYFILYLQRLAIL